MTRLLTRALLVFAALASPVRASTNVDGVSGLLSVPTAEVVGEGEISFTLSRHLTDVIASEPGTLVRVYSGTVGFLPGLEITGRMYEFPNIPDVRNQVANLQDRSISLKYRFLDHEDWQAAFGTLDVSGQAQIQESYYGVVTYSGLTGLELTAGAGTQQLDGLFGGVRWTPLEYASLLGEFDTGTYNYGLELRPLKGVSLKGGMLDEHPAFSASYTLALNPQGQSACCPLNLATSGLAYAELCEHAAAVRDALVCESFTNVVVGTDGQTMYVAFESRRFREQIDAIGVAAAIVLANCGVGIESVVLVPKVDDVPMLRLRGRLDSWLAFFNLDKAAQGIMVEPYRDLGFAPGTVFAEEGNKKNWQGDLELRLTSKVVVNEPSQPAFRVSAGFGLEEDIYLGRGLTFKARQDWPAFNEITDKTDPLNRDAYLSYLGNLAQDTYIYGTGGYLGNERFGGKAELAHYLEGGRFKFSAHQAYISDESGVADTKDRLGLGELAYFEPALDFQLSVLGGSFIEGDNGIRVDATRYFGPTELTFFAYDTDATKPHGGFRLFVPLPWLSEGRHSDWRATGTEYFGYQYRTDADPWGKIPQSRESVEMARKRLRPAYVQAHLADMRRAVVLYLPYLAGL